MKSISRISTCTNGKVISLFIICLIFSFLTSTRVYALDPLGPPVSDINKRQLKAGFEYSMSSLDIELVKGKVKEKVNEVPSYSGSLIDFSIDDVKSDKLNVYVGYGFEQNQEVFFRLGASNAKYGRSDLEPTNTFESDYSPSLGAGLRLTFFNQSRLKIGGVAQAQWSQYSAKIDPSRFVSTDNIMMKIFEAQVSIGALYQLTSYLSFYGGPFYHYATGEYSANFLYSDNFQLTAADDTWDIKVNSAFGGYVGACLTIIQNLNVNFEYQMTGSANALAAGIVFGF